MAKFARDDFTFFGSPIRGIVSYAPSLATLDILFNIPPLRCLDGDIGGLGVGTGTSESSLWNIDMFGWRSLTRLTTSVFEEELSSSVFISNVPGRGLRMLFSLENMVLVYRSRRRRC